MFEVPEQIVVVPKMAPGVPGAVFTVIDRVWEPDDPQVLSAVTVIFPLFEAAVAVILLLVDVPDQPPGKFHV